MTATALWMKSYTAHSANRSVRLRDGRLGAGALQADGSPRTARPPADCGAGNAEESHPGYMTIAGLLIRKNQIVCSMPSRIQIDPRRGVFQEVRLRVDPRTGRDAVRACGFS